MGGANTTSPRYEIPLAILGSGGYGTGSALIVGNYKIIGGYYAGTAFRQEPEWPTEAACCDQSCWSNKSLALDCGTALAPTCLFDVRADPMETKNLFTVRPRIAKQMAQRVNELAKSVYDPHTTDRADKTAYPNMVQRYGYWVGPWMDAVS